MRILPVMALLASMAATHTLYAGDDAAPPVPALYEGKSASEWAKLLTAEDVATRKRAAYALWKLGPDAGQAALPLVEAIRDADPYVRATSAKAVERIGSEAVRPVLQELVGEIVDPRPEVSHEAVTLLWRLGPLAAEVVPGFRKGLASEDPVVRANAAAALGNAGDAARSAVREIEKLLADRDEAVRDWSAKSLARIEPARAFASERAEVRLAALKTWGLTIKGNSLEVSQKMETNLPGVFGAGDLVSYPGKLKLIATGFGEAAMAVCGAKLVVDPKARYFPGHSSEMTGAETGTPTAS